MPYPQRGGPRGRIGVLIDVIASTEPACDREMMMRNVRLSEAAGLMLIGGGG